MKHPAPGATSRSCTLQNSLSFFHALTAEANTRCVQAQKLQHSDALPLPGWDLRVFPSIHHVSSDWDETAPAGNPFLGRNYLEALEACPPRNMEFVYLVFYKHGKPQGLAYGQVFDLNIRKSLEAPLKAQKGWMGALKAMLAGLGRFQMLVCGNMMLTGANGFYFPGSALEGREVALLLDQAFRAAAESLRARGRKVDLVMVKDISPCCPEVSQALAEQSFCDFSFQPSMTLRLDPSWKTFEDYLDAMSSKYRVRARRAFKKRNDIRRRELNAHIASLEAPAMYALYKEVASNSDFNAFELHPDYFAKMKSVFPDQFRVFGYYQGEELVGFCTTMRNGDALDAHFLGFHGAFNASHQLYLNMLYDIVGIAIEEGAAEVGFARTAMEIKSSVGAEPQHFDCRLYHYQPLSNRLMPFFIRMLEPRVQWIQRHPFRQ